MTFSCLVHTILQIQPFVLPGSLTLTVSIVGSGLVVASNLVLVDGQAFKADRATGVDLVSADANLCSEAVAHAVCETGSGVPVDTGGVDLVHEALGVCRVRGHDGVGVVGAVGVDVGDGVAERGDGLDANGEGQVLGVVVFGEDVLDVVEVERLDGGLARSVAAQRHTLGSKGGRNGREDSGQRRVLNEKSLDGVTGSRVAGL